MTGITRGRKYGPCPSARKIKDPIKYPYFRIFGQWKNQINFRGEVCDMNFDEWLEVWGWKINNRGRTKNDYCMTRIDSNKPWNKDNCIVVPRNNGRNHNVN